MLQVVRAHKQRLVEEAAAAAAEEGSRASDSGEEEEGEAADASPPPAKPKQRKEMQLHRLTKRLKTESGKKAKQQKQSKGALHNIPLHAIAHVHYCGMDHQSMHLMTHNTRFVPLNIQLAYQSMDTSRHASP